MIICITGFILMCDVGWSNYFSTFPQKLHHHFIVTDIKIMKLDHEQPKLKLQLYLSHGCDGAPAADTEGLHWFQLKPPFKVGVEKFLVVLCNAVIYPTIVLLTT